MVNQAALATTLAVLGAICWSLQIIPQIILNHRRKTTDGLSTTLMIVWACAGVPLGIYNIISKVNIGLIIQPQLFMVFAMICTVQAWHYKHSFSLTKSVTIVLGALIILGAMEVAGIELLLLAQRRNQNWAVTFIGVLSAVMINIGLLPQFWEIYKAKAVIGVSFTFLAVDSAGAIFSFLSLFFDNGGRFNILAGVSYGLLAVEEGVIFVIAFVLWMRARPLALPMDEIPVDK